MQHYCLRLLSRNQCLDQYLMKSPKKPSRQQKTGLFVQQNQDHIEHYKVGNNSGYCSPKFNLLLFYKEEQEIKL